MEAASDNHMGSQHLHPGYLGSAPSRSPTGSDNSDLSWPSNDSFFISKIQLSPAELVEAATTTNLSTRPRRVQSEEELCLICGDRASGYHYNALSCEGCKGFFRRSVTRNTDYVCKSGGNCEMDMWMRRKCQSCRLRRCREVGMKEECLLSEEQCRARDARRKARQKSVDKPRIPAVVHIKREPLDEEAMHNPLQYLTQGDRHLIETLVVNQEKFEIPAAEDLAKITTLRVLNSNRPSDMCEDLYRSMVEMTILVTQLVVEFAKRLPGFMSLHKEDQIVLLKSSASEVMILRTARRYDVETDCVIFGDGVPMSRDAMRATGLRDYVDVMFDFCRRLCLIGVDNAEYAMMTAMSIIAERAGLYDLNRISFLQESYLEALVSYTRYRRQDKPYHVASLIMKLTELRTLSVEHSRILFNMKVEKGSLPPLLSEYLYMFEGDD